MGMAVRDGVRDSLSLSLVGPCVDVGRRRRQRAAWLLVAGSCLVAAGCSSSGSTEVVASGAPPSVVVTDTTAGSVAVEGTSTTVAGEVSTSSTTAVDGVDEASTGEPVTLEVGGEADSAAKQAEVDARLAARDAKKQPVIDRLVGSGESVAFASCVAERLAKDLDVGTSSLALGLVAGVPGDEAAVAADVAGELSEAELPAVPPDLPVVVGDVMDGCRSVDASSKVAK